MSDLRESLLQELADMLDAEQQLVKALPKLAHAASSGELREALEEHADETSDHLDQVKQIFTALNATPKAKKCHAIQGLIAEAEHRIADHGGDPLLIGMAQKIEHYEIASYGTLRSWASLLEEDEAADMLSEVLDQEKAFDERLTEIAESTVNIEAAEEEAALDEEVEEEEAPPRSRQHD